MSSEETNVRYFGGQKVSGPVRELQAQTFSELIAENVRMPVELKITKSQFLDMPKTDRNKAKEVPYIVAATFRESPSQRRTDEALVCNLVFLDLDEEKDGECPAAKFVRDPKSLAVALAPFAFAAYTTASGTSEKPRMRVMVSASKIPLHRYPDVVLDVAKRMGLKKVTPESTVAVQPMFLPTIFSDECGIMDTPLIIEEPGRSFTIADLPAEIEGDAAEDTEDELRNLRPQDSTFTLFEVEKALGFIDPDSNYSEWLKVAAALKHQFGAEHDEKAYRIFDVWSAKGTKYQSEDETRLKWDSLRQTPKGRAPITIGTLIQMAESGGWKKAKLAERKKAKEEEFVIPDFRPCLIHASKLESMDIPQRVRLLDHWLCEGDLGYIFAARGVGKTWMSMALLSAISQEQELGAWRAGKKRCKVLYVDGEMPMKLTQSRSRSLKMQKGDVTFLHHESVFNDLETSLDIGRESHRTGISNLIISEEFGVLVLDNLSALALGVDENKGDEYEPLKNWLLCLRRRKVTVIVIHHAGRSGLMRGHSKREDDCSWILELKDAKKDGEDGAKFISHFAKPSRNTGDSLPDLQWHITTKNEVVSIMCEEAAAGEYEQFIRNVHDGVERQKDMADLMQKPEGTISKWAKKAVEEGRIRREGQKLLPIAMLKTTNELDDLW